MSTHQLTNYDKFVSWRGKSLCWVWWLFSRGVIVAMPIAIIAAMCGTPHEAPSFALAAAIITVGLITSMGLYPLAITMWFLFLHALGQVSRALRETN